jgi:hypothetical protein
MVGIVRLTVEVKEGQGSALDPLGPEAPDPILLVPNLASALSVIGDVPALHR